jgi:hypothetical protein
MILKQESERGRLQRGAFALFPHMHVPVAAAGFSVQTVYLFRITVEAAESR